MQVVEILPRERPGPVCSATTNTMFAGDLVTQGVKASTAMILSQLSSSILVLTPEGLININYIYAVLASEILVASDFDKVAGTTISNIIICNF